MNTYKNLIMVLMRWFILLLKITIALSLLAIAKVTLRTNPVIATAVLGSAVILVLVWYFAPQIKQFFKSS